MIDVALLSVIRRWHHRDGISIRAIARRTGLSRNTVRKYLASGVVDPQYPKRKGPSKLDEYSKTLTNWLNRETRRKRKQRQSVKQLLHETGEFNKMKSLVLRVAVRLYPYHLHRVKRFSLTGERTGQALMVKTPSCKLLILS